MVEACTAVTSASRPLPPRWTGWAARSRALIAWLVLSALAVASGLRDHYAVLGVPPTADTATIRRAYKSLARKYHPDVNPDGQDSFLAISEAHDVLTDEAKRRAYDYDRQQQQQRGGWPTSGQHHRQPGDDGYMYTVMTADGRVWRVYQPGAGRPGGGGGVDGEHSLVNDLTHLVMHNPMALLVIVVVIIKLVEWVGLGGGGEEPRRRGGGAGPRVPIPTPHQAAPTAAERHAAAVGARGARADGDRDTCPSELSWVGGRDVVFQLVTEAWHDAMALTAPPPGAATPVLHAAMVAAPATLAWATSHGVDDDGVAWLLLLALPHPACKLMVEADGEGGVILLPRTLAVVSDVAVACSHVAGAHAQGARLMPAWVCMDDVARGEMEEEEEGSGVRMKPVEAKLGRRPAVVAYHASWARLLNRRSAGSWSSGEVEAGDGAASVALVRVHAQAGTAVMAVMPLADEVEDRAGCIAGWLLSVWQGNVPLRDASDTIMSLLPATMAAAGPTTRTASVAAPS